MAAPIPREPPVTSATLPSSFPFKKVTLNPFNWIFCSLLSHGNSGKLETLDLTRERAVVNLLRVALMDRVKTHVEQALFEKVDRSDRAISAWQHLRKGKATPENRVVLCFHTASVDSGPR
jgi:hypothetical protein